jgi:DNA-directed RNA polymerase specialized sigma24 family protein
MVQATGQAMKSLTNESFKELLQAMQRGEDQAFDTFFQEHYDRLVRFAKKRIGSFPLRTFDEEDLALSAIHSLFEGLRENRYEAQSNVELWRILISITNCKLVNLRQKVCAQKRGGGDVRGDSIWVQTGENNFFHEQRDHRLDGAPDACLELLETTDLLFQQLESDDQRKIARLLLEGYRIDDIATELDCVRRTIERKLARIRELWSEVLNND